MPARTAAATVPGGAAASAATPGAALPAVPGGTTPGVGAVPVPRVSVDGQPVPRTIVREVFDASPCAWYYNMSDRTIWVKFAKPAKKDFTVTVSTEKFDLIGMAED